MLILACATHSERWFPGFVESCRRQGLPLAIVGWGQKWRGFSWRFTLYKEYLQRVPPDELVLITDAFDSIMMANASEIESKFQMFGSPIVFSAEPPTHAMLEKVKHYFFGDCNGGVINGGTYAGRAGALLAMMNELDYSDDTDDQELLTSYCREHGSTVDWRGDLFLHWTTLFPSTVLQSAQLYSGRLVVWPDDEPAWPTLVTSPGAFDGPRKHLLQLGYDPSMIPHIPNEDRWKKLQLYVPVKQIGAIVGLILLAVLLIYFFRKRSR